MTLPRKTVRRLDVTTRLDGSTLQIPIIELAGAEEGPTLLVVSALHGNEWLSNLMVRQVISSLESKELRGRVVLVPVANPIGLEAERRMVPDRSDEPDMNRVWPGRGSWLAQQMAGALAAELDGANCVIDIHAGGWGHTMDVNAYPGDIDDQGVRIASAEAAVAFGQPVIRGLNVVSGFPGPTSIEGYSSAIRKIPAIAPNLGGLGFSAAEEADWIDRGARGIEGVAQYLGIVDGEPPLAGRYFHFASRGHRITPTVGGLLDPVIGPSTLGSSVAGGTVLARILSPYTFEVLEELVAPCDGILFSCARMHMVSPGDFAYFVADAGHEQSRWADASGGVQGTAASLLGL